MPQMAPMLWTLIMLMTMMTLMIITTNIYFSSPLKYKMFFNKKFSNKLLKW